MLLRCLSLADSDPVTLQANVLSFPKIISGRIGGAVQPGSEWRQWHRIVGLLDARAHLSVRQRPARPTIQQFEAAQGVWSIGMSKGKISHFPAHHLRRNSIGQQYDRRRNWKRLMGAILRTGWSAISTCSAPCTARANACVQAVHSRPSSMLSPLQCKAPYTHSPRCISTGWKMLFARVWREGSSQSASSGHAMSPCRSSRASRAR